MNVVKTTLAVGTSKMYALTGFPPALRYSVLPSAERSNPRTPLLVPPSASVVYESGTAEAGENTAIPVEELAGSFAMATIVCPSREIAQLEPLAAIGNVYVQSGVPESE